MSGLKFSHRVGILVAMFVVSVAGMMMVAPIAQDPAYHLFADSRPLFGIANFGDVMSNLGFAVVGVVGVWSTCGPRRHDLFDAAHRGWPYQTFFVGVGLVCLGSSYYHLAPGNAPLLWDRLPMTVAFMALFYAILADRVDGVAERLCWLLPVICWLFPRARYTGGGYLIWIIAWYAAAKVLEHFDGEIFALLGHTVSGHSLKHLASAVATFMLWRMVVSSGRRPL